MNRPFSESLNKMKAVGLRPTRQRLALARLLFERENHHTTAEQLHMTARDADVRVSLATVYNTLHQFKDAGLLREVVVSSGRSYFDTNTEDHHHFYHEGTGTLIDIPQDSVTLRDLPNPPAGTSIQRVDVVIRVSDQ